MLAVYRYEKINYELGRLRKVLNEAKIPFIPLKGSVLRRYYPEPWMRTSCDIDVLVHEEAVDQAAQIIVDKLGYAYEKKQYHDISLMSDGGVHLELHHTIKENKANKFTNLLLVLTMTKIAKLIFLRKSKVSS